MLISVLYTLFYVLRMHENNASGATFLGHRDKHKKFGVTMHVCESSRIHQKRLYKIIMQQYPELMWYYFLH